MADESISHDGDGSNEVPAQPKDQSEYIKPWMKTLGKSFARNEVIGQYESIADCVNGLLARPEPKDIPASYDGADEELAGIYKKIGVTADEASELGAYFAKKSPKQTTAKETFGDRYEGMLNSYNAGKSKLSDIAKMAEDTGISENPAFFSLMAIVGDNTKSGVFTPPRGGNTQKTGIESLFEKAYGVN